MRPAITSSWAPRLGRQHDVGVTCAHGRLECCPVCEQRDPLPVWARELLRTHPPRPQWVRRQ